MVREKTIGGITEETKDEFHIRKIRGKFPNHDMLMQRLIVLFDLYNDTYVLTHQKKDQKEETSDQ